MSEYGYRIRVPNYSPQEKSRLDPGFQTWNNNTTYNGAEAQGYQDHVCKPVLIDAEGRKRPLIACTPMDGSVTKAEAMDEHVHQPLASGYKTGYLTKEEPTKDYGWSRPAGQVDEFISKVQTEASRPSRTGFLSATQWPQTPNPKGLGETNGYGGYSDSTANAWNKPREKVWETEQEPNMATNGGWSRPSRAGWAPPPASYGYSKPNSDTSGAGWAPPPASYGYSKPNSDTSGAGWATPAPIHSTALTRPTNDIAAVIGNLKEAVNTASVIAAETTRRFTVPRSMVPKADAYAANMDSREPGRRFGSYGGLPRQTINTTETYSSAIDSTELARRYNGVRIP